MIRDYKAEDLAAIEDMFRRSGLPSECMPDANHPLFLIKKVAVANNNPVMAAFTKLTAEQFLLVDHEWETPGERWAMLHHLRDAVVSAVDAQGIQDLTIWCPPKVEKSFGKRLEILGFVKSPWQSYSLIL